MSSLQIEYRPGNLHLPALGLWLDPSRSQAGRERVFVSHAHSDHIARHREIILSAPTAKLLQARLPGKRLEHVLEFGETRRFEYAGRSFRLTLLPAGHILGSAMCLLEADGETLLYTGDFKLKPSFSAEPCEPRPADTLVMETTFGRPAYAFPPAREVLLAAAGFCRKALDDGHTPVLYAYSLGKSQELLHGLRDAGLPIMVHEAVHKMTAIYAEFGQCFPAYQNFDPLLARGKVLLLPPQAGSSLLDALGKIRTAMVTGWAVDASARFRYRCDAAFPLSDHGDFEELIEMVRRVGPSKVRTLHGFAADFALSLRERGFDASALGEAEQLGLPFSALEWRKMDGE